MFDFKMYRAYMVFYQTWSSRDLSLGIETSRDPFLQVLVSVSVLNLRVLVLVLVLNLSVLVSVLVLEPSTLGLGLGLGHSSYAKFRPLG